MATELETDFYAFQRFMVERLNGSDLSLEESVERFRAYQRELTELRQRVREAEEQCAAGKSGPLEVEALKRRVRERLAADGVID